MSELTDLIIQVAGGNAGLALLLVAGFVVDYYQSRSLSDDVESVETEVKKMRDRVRHLERTRMTDGGPDVQEARDGDG